MKRTILVLVLLIIGFQFCQVSEIRTEENRQSAKELSAEIRGTKDAKEKKKLTDKLWDFKPQTIKDVEDLMEIAKSAKDEDEKASAIEALNLIEEYDDEPAIWAINLIEKEEGKQLKKILLNVLDDSDRDMRMMAIVNIGLLKIKEAAPRLRKIVKGFDAVKGIKHKIKEAMKNPFKVLEIWEEAGEVCAAAAALGMMKDEKAIPILVEKLYDLEDCGSEALGLMGKKALPQILELVRKEIEEEKKNYKSAKYHARWALASIDDKEAKQDLMNIVRNEKEPDIRYRALISLVDYMYDDEVLEMAKDLYGSGKDIKGIKSSLMDVISKTKKEIPFLINILKNDKDPSARNHAAWILGKIGDPSAIPALEEALKDRDKTVRELAVDALITLGDRESFIRLKEYLSNNLGKVAGIEFDKINIELIDNRLKSGKKGPVSSEEWDSLEGIKNLRRKESVK